MPTEDDLRQTVVPATRYALAGMLLGMALVVLGLVERPAAPPPVDEVIATVDGRPISRSAFESWRDALQRERARSGNEPLDESRLLERIIDEELLVGRAVELGLAHRDKLARGYLVQSMMDLATRDARAEEPSTGELEAYYRNHLSWFVPAATVAAEAGFVAAPGAQGEGRAQNLRREWARSDTFPREFAAPPIPLPAEPLPLAKWSELIGGGHAERLAWLTPGELTPPLPWMNGWLVLRCLRRTDATPPPLAELRPTVLERFKRERAEAAFEQYIDRLRRTARIEIHEGG